MLLVFVEYTDVVAFGIDVHGPDADGDEYHWNAIPLATDKPLPVKVNVVFGQLVGEEMAAVPELGVPEHNEDKTMLIQ